MRRKREDDYGRTGPALFAGTNNQDWVKLFFLPMPYNIQSGGGGGSQILVCRYRSGLLTMALTDIIAVLTYLVSFTLLKSKKGMICWLRKKITFTEKNMKKTQNLAAENIGFVPMVTNMAANPVLLLLWTLSLCIGA